MLTPSFGLLPFYFVRIIEGLGPLLHSVLISRSRHDPMFPFCFARLLARACDILGLASLSLPCSGRRYGSFFFLSARDTCRMVGCLLFNALVRLPRGTALFTNEARVDVGS